MECCIEFNTPLRRYTNTPVPESLPTLRCSIFPGPRVRSLVGSRVAYDCARFFTASVSSRKYSSCSLGVYNASVPSFFNGIPPKK